MQREGHQIGNHTYSHIRLDGSDAAGQLADIEEAQRAICGILGTESCWLRPPYGLVAPTVRARITVPMVHWSVDPRDWESRNTDKVVRAVLEADAARRYHSAARYLLHLCRRGASDRGHAGGAGMLLDYGGGAAEPLAEFNRRKECCTAPPENDSILPHHGHNLAENLSVGTVNRGVGVIFPRQQPDMAALAGKALDCGLIVNHGHHDLALVTGLLLAHYHQIAGRIPAFSMDSPRTRSAKCVSPRRPVSKVR